MRLHVSEYLDDGRVGVVDDDNRIIVRLSVGLSRAEATLIVDAVNHWLDHARDARLAGAASCPACGQAPCARTMTGCLSGCVVTGAAR